MENERAKYKCDKCGKEIEMCDVGYLGPKDRDSVECNPFVEMECLCVACEHKRAPTTPARRER